MRKVFEASGKTVDAAIDAACLLAGTTVDMVEIEVLELGGRGLFGFGRKDARVRVILDEPDQPAAQPEESTFGRKKSRRERYEQKNRTRQEEVKIRPIVTADQLPEEERRAVVSQHSAEKAEKGEAREKGEPREKAEKRRPPREKGERRRSNGEAQPAGKPQAEKAAPRGEKTEKKRESRAAEVHEGEMADALTAEALAFLQPIFVKMHVEPVITPQVQDGILWLSFSGKELGLLIGRRGETLNSLQYLVNLAVNRRRHDHVRLVLNVEGYRESREETLAALAHKMADKAVRSGRRVELEPMNPHERRVVHIALQEDERVETSSHGEEPYRRVVISCKRSNRRPRRRGGRGRGKQGQQGQPQATQPQATQPQAAQEMQPQQEA